MEGTATDMEKKNLGNLRSTTGKTVDQDDHPPLTEHNTQEEREDNVQAHQRLKKRTKGLRPDIDRTLLMTTDKSLRNPPSQKEPTATDQGPDDLQKRGKKKGRRGDIVQHLKRTRQKNTDVDMTHQSRDNADQEHLLSDKAAEEIRAGKENATTLLQVRYENLHEQDMTPVQVHVARSKKN